MRLNVKLTWLPYCDIKVIKYVPEIFKNTKLGEYELEKSINIVSLSCK